MAQHTVIDHQTHVKGTLRGDQPVEVRGLLEGHVQLEEVLTVAQEGQVIAQVQVREAIIHGSMSGQLKASERIIITASARVEGTIEAPIIRVDDGARVRGEVVMDVEGSSPVVKPSTTRASTPAPAQASQPARSSWAQPAASPAKVEAPAPAQPAPPSPQAPQAPQTQEVEAHVEAQVGAFTSPARQGASAAAAAAAAARAPRTGSNVATISAPEPAQEPTPETQAPQDEPTPSEAAPEHEEAEAFEQEHVEDHAEPVTPREDEPAQDDDDDLDDDELDDVHRPAVNLSAEVLAEYDDYTVKELREALRRIDLPVSGTKTELIERLVEAKSQGQ